MPTVNEFLIERMENAGIKHVFGVTGEYISPFFRKLNNSPNISLVTTADEAGAAFAADAYARTSGI
jgi:thiamine pyrophosphate-dependent acetolactate synthase large subunit-like protein